MKEVLIMSAAMIALVLAGTVRGEGGAAAAGFHVAPALPAALTTD